MTQSKRVHAEIRLANIQARRNWVMEESKKACRDHMFVAGAEMIRMYVVTLLAAEEELFQAICDKPPMDRMDAQLAELLEKEKP